MQKEMNRFSKKELCDIYCNLTDGIWDRRIGSKPYGFDLLPRSKYARSVIQRIKRAKTKEEIVAPYMRQIEALTTLYQRKKYKYVNVRRYMTEEEFNSWWEELSNGHN